MSRCQEGASPRIMAQGSFDHKRVTCGILVSPSVFSGHDEQQLAVPEKGDFCLRPGTRDSSLGSGKPPPDFAMPTP